jgi:uncharacterized protein YcnI
LLIAGGVVVFAMPPAWAHVSVTPREALSGAEQRYCIRVPSEKSIPTIGLEIEFPAGLEIIAIEAPAGWHGTAHKDRQGRIVSASWEGGIIPPAHAVQFGVVARNPKVPTELSWKAIQKYQDTSEVHWVGPSQAQSPAATTRVQEHLPTLPASMALCSQEPSPSSSSH